MTKHNFASSPLSSPELPMQYSSRQTLKGVCHIRVRNVPSHEQSARHYTSSGDEAAPNSVAELAFISHSWRLFILFYF